MYLDRDLELLPALHAGSPRVWRTHQQNLAGGDLKQVDLVSLEIESLEEETATVVSGPSALVIADTVFDTLQAGSGNSVWKADALGYNVLIVTTPEMTPNPRKTYRILVKATPASGDPFYFGFRQPTHPFKYQ